MSDDYKTIFYRYQAAMNLLIENENKEKLRLQETKKKKETEKKKPKGTLHDKNGQFSSKEEATCWSGGLDAYETGEGKYQVKPNGKGIRKLTTKHPTGRKPDGGKHPWKCKDKTPAWENRDPHLEDLEDQAETEELIKSQDDSHHRLKEEELMGETSEAIQNKIYALTAEKEKISKQYQAIGQKLQLKNNEIEKLRKEKKAKREMEKRREERKDKIFPKL